MHFNMSRKYEYLANRKDAIFDLSTYSLVTQLGKIINNFNFVTICAYYVIYLFIAEL